MEGRRPACYPPGVRGGQQDAQRLPCNVYAGAYAVRRSCRPADCLEAPKRSCIAPSAASANHLFTPIAPPPARAMARQAYVEDRAPGAPSSATSAFPKLATGQIRGMRWRMGGVWAPPVRGLARRAIITRDKGVG